MKIEKLREEHIEALAEIENESFSKPWSVKSFKSELTSPSSVFFVAVEKDAPIGCISMNNALGEGFISKVMVRKDCRGNGVGKKLLEWLVNYAKENDMFSLTLEVRQSNKVAQGLYLAFGFKEVGKRKNFYSFPDEDAIIMTKEIYNENIRN